MLSGMDTQPLQPSGQDNQQPAPPMDGVPTAPVPPTQQMQQMPAVPTPTPGGGQGRKMLVVVAVVVVLALAVGGFLLARGHKPAPAKGSQTGAATTTSTTSDLANEKAIPLGAAATDGTFRVTLLGVKPNPAITGDAPAAGDQYVEADFSVTTIANKDNYAFNMSYLPSIVPTGDTMGDIELNPIDYDGGTTSPATFARIPAKKVQIAGKNSIVANGVIPYDGSAKTVTAYALFEVRQGDQGEIVWQGLDNIPYHFLTK